MLHLTRIRDLTLQAATSPDRPAYISAASGLVRVGQHLYVVADDELQLGVFVLGANVPGSLLRLFPGELPDKPKKRKKLKPDLEILLQLPPFAGHEHGALLALGSGSTSRRCRGVLLALDALGAVRGAPRVLDVAAWFAGLAGQFDELNLEGAWVSNQQLYLLQRGNKHHSANAVVRYQLQDLLTAIAQGDVVSALTPEAIHTMQLGDINGVPLCFSDACAVSDDRWLFTAVAEDSDNAVADGEFLGAAIGMADASNKVLWISRVEPKYKIEGIEVRPQAHDLEVLLVTDADDVAVPASLLSVRI